MRVLVTGGAGFIGSAVCRHFIRDLGHEVVVVDKLTYAGNLASLAPVASDPRYSFERLDICNAEGIRAAFFKHQPDAVVHLSGGKPCRPLDLRVGRFRSNKCGRHFHVARSGARLSRSRQTRREGFRFHSRLDRRSLRIAR